MAVAELVVGGGMLLSTLALTFFTFHLRNATNAMAEAALHRPYVHLFLRPENATVGLSNIGDRVAHDIRIRILKDDHSKAQNGFLGQLLFLRHPIPSIPPGGEAKDGSVLGVIAPGSDTELAVEILYRDGDGRSYRETTRARAADYADWFRNTPMGGSSAKEVKLSL